MNGQFDYWELLAGVALFLFAMSQLETALKALGGRSLAVYLRRSTGNRFTAVFGGFVGTAFLQSSSVVGLIALAFTGAGLLALPSALGIIFGSNLGTTLTGWIVATLGFKFDILDLALPLIGFGGLMFIFARQRSAEYGRSALALGLLLLALQMMKSSVMSVEQLIDVNDLAGLAAWQYLLFGILVAAVIQSSSATMIITLAALDAGIINLPNAAAIAIGADLGTTTTVVLGAVGGSQVKKQVAAGHVLFNVITDVIAFALRIPLLAVIAWAGISDALFSLVAFHSLFNFLGLLIFVPFLAPFANGLTKLFPETKEHEALYLSEVSHSVGQAAVDAVERETALLIFRATRLLMTAFEPPLNTPPGESPIAGLSGSEHSGNRSFDERYRAAKTLEGEIIEFTIGLQTSALESDETERLSQMLSAARTAMHSAKAIKNIRHNLVDMASPASSLPESYIKGYRQAMQAFLDRVYQLRDAQSNTIQFEDLIAVLQEARKSHDELHDAIYAGVRSDSIDESQISSLLNVTREVLTSCESLIFSLGDYYLGAAQSESLERMVI
jgi:phosphate:Na+ symporter